MCCVQLLAALFDALVAPDTCTLAGECLAGLLASTSRHDPALDDGTGSVHSDSSGGHEADSRSKRGGGGFGRKAQHKAAADRDRLHQQHQQVRRSCMWGCLTWGTLRCAVLAVHGRAWQRRQVWRCGCA